MCSTMTRLAASLSHRLNNGQLSLIHKHNYENHHHQHHHNYDDDHHHNHDNYDNYDDDDHNYDDDDKEEGSPLADWHRWDCVCLLQFLINPTFMMVMRRSR